MDTDGRCEKLARAVCRQLEKGLFPGEKTMGFIDSTFSSPTAEEIAAIMADPDNSEREVLVQVLFFPEEKLQKQLEPLIQASAIDESDLTVLVDQVKQKMANIAIHLPDDRGCFDLAFEPGIPDMQELGELALSHFVFHLNCPRKIPATVLSAVAEHVPECRHLATWVRLRNARFDFTEKNILWLTDLFAASYKFSGMYLDILDFALAFTDGLAADTDICAALMARKRQYAKAVRQNTEFEAQIQKANMETLIMQGKRGSGMGTAAAEKKMAMIDRMAYGIYGNTEHIEPLVSENSVAPIHTDKDMQHVMKILGT